MQAGDMEQKMLPVGIENFDEMRTEGYYYVDKTAMIGELLRKRGKVNLFTRPCRFGKSLNMGMLKNGCGMRNAECSSSFGFTDGEVKEMLAYYGLEDKYHAIKEWYDGYCFGDTDVYCPWDVINHVSKLRSKRTLQPQDYWSNTSGNGSFWKMHHLAQGMMWSA